MTIDWTNPYAKRDGTWLKGNLHCHSTHSDGKMPPTELAAFYAGKGYDFLSITDHHHVTPTSEYPRADLVGLTGIEADSGGRFHMGLIAPPAGAPVHDPAEKDPALQQQVIDRNVAAGNLAVLHHPDWELSEHYPMERLLELDRYTGIEIYNGVIEFLEGSPLSTAKWDRLLARGRKVLGFANQDLHAPQHYLDCCNIVRAETKDAASIFQALATGNFYAYYGVTLTDVGREGKRLFVKTANASLVRFIGAAGKVLKKVEGKEASIEFQDGPAWQYVRVECLGRGEEASYTQPIFRE